MITQTIDTAGTYPSQVIPFEGYTPLNPPNPTHLEAYESSSITTQSTIPTTPLPDELSCPDTELLTLHAHRLLIEKHITASSHLFKIYANILLNAKETDKGRNPVILQLKQKFQELPPSKINDRVIKFWKRIHLAPFKTAIDRHNKNVIYIHGINTDDILFQAPPQPPKAPTFIDCPKTNIITANNHIKKARNYLQAVQQHNKDELVKIKRAVDKCSTEQEDNLFEKIDTWTKTVEDIIENTQNNIQYNLDKFTTFKKEKPANSIKQQTKTKSIVSSLKIHCNYHDRE